MLLKLNLYDLFVLSFVQLVVSTVLVLSPAREIGSRFRWTGSRITEVVVGSVGAIAITAIAVELTHLTWGLQIGGLETAAYPLAVVSIVVIALQPDRNVVGCVFYASFGSASLAFIVWAAYIAVVATTSILETVTASLVLCSGCGRVPGVDVQHQLPERRAVPRPAGAGRCPRPTRVISRSCRCTSRPTTSRRNC